MTHRGDNTTTPLSRFVQIERRTAEGSRLIRDNLQNVLRPLVQSGSETLIANNRVTLSNWIQGRTIPVMNAPSTSTIGGGDENSFVINVEDTHTRGVCSLDLVPHHTSRLSPEDAPYSEPTTPDISSAPDGTPPEQNQPVGNNDDLMNIPLTPEATVAIAVFRKYLPFITILLVKTIFDHIPGILLFAGLAGTFTYINSKLKEEIAKHSQRSVGLLWFFIVQLIATICFYYFLYADVKLYSSLVFIPPYDQPLTVTELLWLVGGNDFVLRLVTLIIKVVVTLIPHRVFPAKRRGKWYVAIETTSQLYRSLIPIQPWLYYLLESYHGPQKVVGVFLSAAYMVAKGSDLVSRARSWWTSMEKLLETVQLGIDPSKEELNQAGPTCPICHDVYDTPVMLSCRHIFCESCVTRWFDSEQTCPMCRARIFDDPSWRDGSTTHFVQLF